MNDIGSYQNLPNVATAGPRDIESWALIQSARDLHQAQQNPDDMNMFRSVINANMILWTVFQDAVIDDASPLPFEIRNNILNLSIFIDKHSMYCLGTENVEDLDILISINQNIAAGLAQKPDVQPDEQSDGAIDKQDANSEAPVSMPANDEAGGIKDIKA